MYGTNLMQRLKIICNNNINEYDDYYSLLRRLEEKLSQESIYED